MVVACWLLQHIITVESTEASQCGSGIQIVQTRKGEDLAGAFVAASFVVQAVVADPVAEADGRIVVVLVDNRHHIFEIDGFRLVLQASDQLVWCHGGVLQVAESGMGR